MEKQNGFWSNSWPFISVLAIVILSAILIVGLDDISAPMVNGSASEIYEIRVPESFGKTVGIAKSNSFGHVSILFENGVFYTFIDQGVPYHIVWEES